MFPERAGNRVREAVRGSFLRALCSGVKPFDLPEPCWEIDADVQPGDWLPRQPVNGGHCPARGPVGEFPKSTCRCANGPIHRARLYRRWQAEQDPEWIPAAPDDLPQCGGLAVAVTESGRVRRAARAC